MSKSGVVLVVMGVFLGASTVDARTWSSDPFKVTYESIIQEAQSDVIPIEIPLEAPGALQGIMLIDDRYRAMIDDKIVQRGDFVGKYRVQKITDKDVLMVDPQGATIRLEFDPK
jgi:hypothetical protein